jgi:hypothetical protein
MANITMKIDSRGFQERSRAYVAKVRGKLAETAPEILNIILEDIASRAPTPEQEEDLIMYGEGGISGLPVTNVRQSSTNSGRIRFQREPGMWIQEAIHNPANFSISPGSFSIRVGNIAALNELTKYSWTDYSKKYGAIEHISKYGQYSLFEFGSNVLGAGHVTASYGDQNYFLNPADYTRVREMNKVIPPFGMLTLLNSFAINEAIKERIRQVDF